MSTFDPFVFDRTDDEGRRYYVDRLGRRIYEGVMMAPLWAFPVPPAYRPALGSFKRRRVPADRPALGAFKKRDA